MERLQSMGLETHDVHFPQGGAAQVLSTVRNADRIFVLERGQLIEHGRHDDLVASSGIYARLWGVQTGERQKIV